MWNVTALKKATNRKKSETSDMILLSYPPLPNIWGYIYLCDVSQALTGLISHSDGINILKRAWNIGDTLLTTTKIEILEDKAVPMPLCPPQSPLGLLRSRTQAYAVKGLRLIAPAMPRPLKTTKLFNSVFTSAQRLSERTV
jgi:hypothetical protein